MTSEVQFNDKNELSDLARIPMLPSFSGLYLPLFYNYPQEEERNYPSLTCVAPLASNTFMNGP